MSAAESNGKPSGKCSTPFLMRGMFATRWMVFCLSGQYLAEGQNTSVLGHFPFSCKSPVCNEWFFSKLNYSMHRIGERLSLTRLCLICLFNLLSLLLIKPSLGFAASRAEMDKLLSLY